MDVIHQASVRTSTYLEDGGVDFRRVKQKAERNLRFWWQWGNILYLKSSYATTLLSNWSWTFFNNSLLSLLCVCVMCIYGGQKTIWWRQFFPSPLHRFKGSTSRCQTFIYSLHHLAYSKIQSWNFYQVWLCVGSCMCTGIPPGMYIWRPKYNFRLCCPSTVHLSFRDFSSFIGLEHIK